MARKASCTPRAKNRSRVAISFSRMEISPAAAIVSFPMQYVFSGVRNGVLGLVHEIDWIVMLDRRDHGLEDVDIPAIRDSQTDRFVSFRQQSPAKRNAEISCDDSQDN
jgi:hypothetical protein